MPYVPPERSFEGVPMRNIAEIADTKYFQYYDALQNAYIDKGVFTIGNFSVNFGEIVDELETKVKYNRIHALIQHLHILLFHTENLKLGLKNRYPTGMYNGIYDGDGNVIDTKTRIASEGVVELKNLGVEFNLE